MGYTALPLYVLQDMARERGIEFMYTPQYYEINGVKFDNTGGNWTEVRKLVLQVILTHEVKS